MEGNLSVVYEALFQQGEPSGDDRRDLFLIGHAASCDSFEHGLQELLIILTAALSPGSASPKLNYHSWSGTQIESIVSLGFAVVSALLSLPPDQVEPIAVAVVQRLLDFAVCYLENSEHDVDISLQNQVWSLMELAWNDGSDKTPICGPCSLDRLQEVWLVVCSEENKLEVDPNGTWDLQGFNSVKPEKSVDQILMSFASELVQFERQDSDSCVPFEKQEDFVTVFQRWAVFNLDCIRRLMKFSRKIILGNDSSDQKLLCPDKFKRLSFCLRIFQLLKRVTEKLPWIDYDTSLLQEIAKCTDMITSMFGSEVESLRDLAGGEGSIENLQLLLVEEFICVVRVIWRGSSLLQNVQVCIVASMIGNLGVSSEKYEKDNTNLRGIMHLPRTTIFMLKLIKDLKKQTVRAVNIHLTSDSGLSVSDYDVSCIVHGKKIELLDVHSDEKLLEIIFSSSMNWLQDLMYLLQNLHEEGNKLVPVQRVEKSQPIVPKPIVSVNAESNVPTDDEALFGDLFSEGNRPTLSSDDQTVNVDSCHSCINMPMQAAYELLIFLKDCIFSNEWSSFLFSDACKKIQENHIDVLLSLLKSDFCPDSRSLDGRGSLNDGKKIINVQGLCYDLMHNLLVHRVLSDTHEGYLVEEIMKVEKENFVYNKLALCLVAYAVASRSGSSGIQMRTRLYKSFVDWVMIKALASCSQLVSVKDFLSTLPAVFHVEILLMAFHLSSDVEKVAFASSVCQALKKVNIPSDNVSISQLSRWALVISTLIILLRHMLAYAQSCPSPLLISLKSKWREVSYSSLIEPNIGNDQIFSWVFVVMKNLSESFLEDESVLRSLVGRLLEDFALPLLSMNELAFEFLQLNPDDIVASLSNLLAQWKGRKPSDIEDLLIERYFFSLCSDFNTANSLSSRLYLKAIQDCQLSDITFFCLMNSFFADNKKDIRGTHLLELTIEALQYSCKSDFYENFEDLGWDFLRNGVWVSYILSLFNVGLNMYCERNDVASASLNWIEKSANDTSLALFAESLASSLVETGGIAMLLRLLATLLRTYLRVYRKAYLDTVSSSTGDACAVASLILKHSSFDKCEQDELMKNNVVCAKQLKFVLDSFSKLKALVERGTPGIFSQLSRECLLHGFPTYHKTSSSIFLSCIMNAKGCISVLAKLCGVEEWRKNTDKEVAQDILELVMAIKFDMVFQPLYVDCDGIISNLSGVNEYADDENIYLLMEIGELLNDFGGTGLGDSRVLECLILKIIDTAILMKQTSLNSNESKLNDEGKNVLQVYCSRESNLKLLLCSLDHCYSEATNAKVLNFFIDVMSEKISTSLLLNIEKKFLDMNVVHLSKWLKPRLLGSLQCESGVQSAQACSLPLRETTNKFISSITSIPSLHQSELQDHFFEALLILLDDAFLEFDVYMAMSYFHFVVQRATRLPLIRLLLNNILHLMNKLASDERWIPGLKILFDFLGNVVNDRGTVKYSSGKSLGKSIPGNVVGSGAAPSLSLGSRSSEALVLATGQEAVSTHECDLTSPDEDEDDATSDGEAASVDKDDEEESNNEKSLATKVCTFTSSGSNFMEQHWYFCYTCDLTVSKGCCSTCAKVCHFGHRVVYSRSSRFFCDCGAGGVRGSSCQCLKPRKYSSTDKGPSQFPSNIHSLLPFSEESDHIPESDSDVDEEVIGDADNSVSVNFFRELQDQVSNLFEELNVESQILQLCSSLLPSIISKRNAKLSQDKTVFLNENKVLKYDLELFHLKKAYKGGSFDLKIKTDYSNTKELRTHLASGSLVKSLLSVSKRGRLAVGEGDKIVIYDVGQLIGQATIAPVTADKNNVKAVSKNIVRFEIVHLTFNTATENYLAVAGYEDCQVLTLNPRGEVIDRLAIELVLQGGYIRRIEWVPGSQVKLMVVTNKFIKIYDLSQDNISPIHYFTLPDNMIADAAIITASQGRMFLIVLSENGCLFRLELTIESAVGVASLKDAVQLHFEGTDAKGSSLYFSASLKIIFVSFENGTTLMCRLNSDMASLVDSSFINDEQDGKLKSASLHRWRELFVGSGMFACISGTKPISAHVVSVEPHVLHAQNMRCTLNSSSHLVGLTSYKPLSKDKLHCLSLYDDGSLQIYSHVPSGTDIGANMTPEKVKKLGSGILNSKAYGGAKPEFPIDYFEKTVCITSDVKLSGDAIRNGDSEVAKQNLASEDGFLESPTPSGFKISFSNSNPDIVMVGMRIHVGNTSASHIPSEITIFHRTIKLDEGMRSWYDFPFTVAECLLADEEFTISVGTTLNGTALPRIDSLEIYGRAKDEFGWKERLDALLNMESRALGVKSLVGVSDKKCRLRHTSFIQEQVIADGLTVLSAIYVMRRLQNEDIKVDPLSKCRVLLETIFESDREHFLQAAACRVLHAAFSNKDRYYQVKDNMRLHGVLKSTSGLLSKLGVGGTTSSSLIDEFTAQIRAVTKIALHRRSNFSEFLEMNGAEIIDRLMHALWEILDFENPDNQTMNNVVNSSVELIYCYAECLAFQGKDIAAYSVTPAVILLKKLLFYPNKAVQSSSSLAIASRLLQMPFPKQTLLANDDLTESLVASSGTEVTTTGNTQVVIEEDSNTSSVQYCCDGCSTVPILRRRWHCTVCPDFDLCEACYRVLDANTLPPPHSRDHPMTAVSIEMELISDVNHNPFSTGEGISSTTLPSASDVFEKSVSPVHVLESSHSGSFNSSMPDNVSISASKKAVNSCILLELMKQLDGWMTTTSGNNAIPVMQLFYRLSSAAGGPFMNSSLPEALNLDKLVKWFLDEMNLSNPFIAKSRSSFGEVIILVFMFFTLMLRNWHQPSSDSTLSKFGVSDSQDKTASQISSDSQASNVAQENNDTIAQLLSACNCLRTQTFTNFLMDILQQLMNFFKSPVANFDSSFGSSPSSGCGALLNVRRDMPSGIYSPFFSDSYAKAHQADMFVDYHRLLLENTFRLIYSLVRPEKHEKNLDKEKIYRSSSFKDLKLDNYQDVLCSYINNPSTNFVRRYARRLFLYICGSKTQYYIIRDAWQFSNEVKKLHKHINKSGGHQNVVSYERNVKIVKCLSTMAEVAASRPRNWQKFCIRNGDILPFLMDGVFYFCEESVIPTLKLLNLSFYTGKDVFHSMQKMEIADSANVSKPVSQSNDTKKKKKSEDVFDEKLSLDMEEMVEVFNDKDGVCLKQFIDCFLLEWNSSSVRTEAKCALYGAWHHGKDSFKEFMLSCLLQRVKSLPMYGQNIIEFTELVAWLLGKTQAESDCKQQHSDLVDRCLTPEIVNNIFETLHSQNELVANHPNSRIYNTLSSLVEFDGYYLESEPCVACSSPEVPYSKMKLESLKSETKFTDNRIIVKCTGSYTIQTVIMNVHDARKSKSVKVLNLYYNNRPVADLSELKNNWSLWKRAKSCHLSFNQSELKVEFPIPITACNFMIELDSFYENLQALSLEPLQCPRCSRPVTDKHGICGNCHENAYQCRQCRNINYENLDSFLCNECGYSKYGRFEFNFMAKPSFTFDEMENDGDMKRGLTAIESESENAHRRYQQLLGFKKPLLKLVSSIGETEIDSQQKDSVQQMMVSLPGPSCKINRKIALLGVLYCEKCKAAFDSVSKSVQTLQGLRRVLMNYLHQKHSEQTGSSRLVVSRSPNNCFGCATTFVTQCLEIIQVLSARPVARKQLVSAGILSELFENNIHQGPKTARLQARTVLCAFSEGDIGAVTELNNLIQKKVMYCLEHHRSMDVAIATREELLLLSEFCSVADEFWESRLRVVFQLLFSSIKSGAKHPSIAEQIILPCLRVISQACTSPKPDVDEKDLGSGKPDTANQSKDDKSLDVGVSGSKSTVESSDKTWDVSKKTHDMQLLSYAEWEKGASYIDFVRRQYKVARPTRSDSRSRSQRNDYLALKYMLRWKRNLSKGKNDLSVFEVGSWVTELILSACSQSIRSEMCMLISLLCAESSSRKFRLINLLLALLPATLSSGESAAEYFDLLFKMIESEDARLFLTVRGCLQTICKLITDKVSNVESLERSMHIDISQGFILHKLVELLGKFLEVPNIRTRFMQDNLLSAVLEALIVIRGLIVQKTKLISDCNRLLQDLLERLLTESAENKRLFIRACICGLQNHAEERRGRSCLFILEQLCNLICPSKPEAVYLLILNKAHTQEEFIRGSMTKNPYSSSEIGPLMRDVKNKICNQLELFGLLEDDYGMELLVAGNITSLDLSIGQVYEQVWRKSNNQSTSASNLLSSNIRDCPPMTVTYRLQGLDGEATEPMIKELEEDREESQDPEVEFAIAGAVREFGGLEILLSMIQRFREDFKSNQERLVAVLNVLMHCCKIKENRRALLKLGALAHLLETARRAFSVEAMEPAEGILLIVESLSLEANESDNINITQSALTVSNEETATSEQAKRIVLMFLERLSHPSNLKKSNKQQRNTEMVARILPYLTYGEPSAMDALVLHFESHLKNWKSFDDLQLQHQANPKDESIALSAAQQKFSVENFVRVSESLKTSSCGERLKDIILEKGITDFAVKHLSESFAVINQPNFKSSPEWSSCLKLPSVPHILSMLRGLSMGHFPTQKCIDDGAVLPLLHALEGVTGENEIGARAENLLDTLADKEGKGDGFLGEKVWNLRHATRDEMRRRALKKREELLQGLGMRQEVKSDGGERIVVAKTVIEGLDDVEEEEDGMACMVCREGYTLRPSDLLGVYSYSKRVNLGVGNARGECVYTTVSYFNIIHFQCHQEAKRGDAALKNPKKEWEGATLRNNESLCNSLFPVRGPLVPLAQYVRHVDQFWDNLNALGRADGSRLRLLTYDIVLMLARFATGASFSSESRGGGRESNSRFLPFMIQMARYLIDQGSPSQKQHVAAQGSEETVQFAMVNALLTESYEHWVQQRRGYLQRGLHHAYMQHTHGRSSGGAADSGEEVLPVVRPMLVYTGLVEQLQRLIKGRKSGEESGGWEALMKERLLNFKEMAGFSKQLLTWLDDMNSATCMMEAFDVMGMLGDALSGGVSTCEDFVLNAINGV